MAVWSLHRQNITSPLLKCCHHQFGKYILKHTHTRLELCIFPSISQVLCFSKAVTDGPGFHVEKNSCWNTFLKRKLAHAPAYWNVQSVQQPMGRQPMAVTPPATTSLVPLGSWGWMSGDYVLSFIWLCRQVIIFWVMLLFVKTWLAEMYSTFEQ